MGEKRKGLKNPWVLEAGGGFGSGFGHFHGNRDSLNGGNVSVEIGIQSGSDPIDIALFRMRVWSGFEDGCIRYKLIIEGFETLQFFLS